MDLVYLANGQACYLKEKIGEKFVVNKIFEFESEFGTEEIQDNNDILVDKIYLQQPIEKIASEIGELKDQKTSLLNCILELNNQKRTIQREVEQITKTKISNEKFIINRSDFLNAKSIALFEKDKINPIVKEDNKEFRGISISMEVKIGDGIERYWGARVYNYDGYQTSNFLCPKYGFLINPTEDEILETAKKRAIELEFSDWVISNTYDKYLTPELIERKKSIVSQAKNKERQSLETELKNIQDKLEKYKRDEQ